MVWAFSNFVENLRTTISKKQRLPQQAKCAWYIPGHCLPISKKERISFMVKNKVVIKERDA